MAEPYLLLCLESMILKGSNTSKNTNGRNQNRIQVQQRGQAGTRGDHNHGGKALSAWQQLQVTAKLKVIRVASVMLAARAMQQVCANNRQQARLKNMAFADSRGLAALVVQGLWKKYMLKKVAHIGPNTLRIMKNYAWKAKFKILCRRRVGSNGILGTQVIVQISPCPFRSEVHGVRIADSLLCKHGEHVGKVVEPESLLVLTQRLVDIINKIP